jgi:outer membrane phospholipase A
VRSLVNQLKESKDDQEIKAILNSLKWKYTSRDHSDLRSLDIFSVLHSGNGKKGNKISRSWGRSLKQVVVENENDKKLTK